MDVGGAMIKKVADNTSFEGKHYRIFDFYQGSRLSWLFVPFADIEAAKLFPHSFSDESLIDKDGMYLDGDEDAQIFIDTYPLHTGYHVMLNEIDAELLQTHMKEKNRISVSQKYWDQREKKTFRVVK